MCGFARSTGTISCWYGYCWQDCWFRPEKRGDAIMSQMTMEREERDEAAQGLRSVVADWAADQEVFRHTHWGKAMMWIFLLSDTFIFSCFLTAYMTMRASATLPWPDTAEVFALTIGGQSIPLILIAIMTFVLISSSGTMAMAVNFGYRRDRKTTAALMFATALFGAAFV